MRAARALAMMILALMVIAAAPKKPRNESAADWLLARLSHGEAADFDARCAKPNEKTPPAWDRADACRVIDGRFIVALLSDAKLQKQITARQVKLKGAYITGDVDLVSVNVAPEFWLIRCHIDGNLNLAVSHWDRTLAIEQTTITGNLNAAQVVTAGDFLFRFDSSVLGSTDLRGAKTGNDLDLENSGFTGPVGMDRANIGGNLILSQAHFAGIVTAASVKVGQDADLRGARFDRDFDARWSNVPGSLVAGAENASDAASFGGALDLSESKVVTDIYLRNVAVAGDINAERIDVGGNALLNNARLGGQLILVDAKIGAGLVLEGSAIAGVFNGDRLNVANVFASGTQLRGTTLLRDAKIGMNLLIDGTSFDGLVEASGATVGGMVDVTKSSFTSTLALNRAKIDGDLNLHSSKFADRVFIDNARIGGSLHVSGNDRFESELMVRDSSIGIGILIGKEEEGADEPPEGPTLRGRVSLQLSHVPGYVGIRDVVLEKTLDLRGANFGWLTISDASLTRADLSELVATELSFARLHWACEGSTMAGGADHWALGDAAWTRAYCVGSPPRAEPRLSLRNAHVTYFQDTKYIWPFAIDLEGFRYDQLGGIQQDPRGDEIHDRTSEEWTDLLARQPRYSPQPYEQLAAVLVASGQREAGEDVAYARRDRQKGQIYARHLRYTLSWLVSDLPAGLLFSAYKWVAGYGIGLHGFVVLVWLGGLTLVGWVVLLARAESRRRGVFWSLGAAFNRLVPVVELTKDFKEYFDNQPDPVTRGRPLNGFQMVFFIFLAIAGWILGFFLLAAIGVLTPK